MTRDVPDPLIGDLDGLEIHLDYTLATEQRLFLLLHLFGHTVQWNLDPLAVEIGRLHVPPVGPTLLPALLAYEREAARYALGLLHALGIHHLDQWLSDYTACDIAYLEHYYRTGDKLEFSSLWRDNTPRIDPQPAPRFTPARRRLRGDGLVI